VRVMGQFLRVAGGITEQGTCAKPMAIGPLGGYQ
jgi:hypothetical protein